MQNIRQYSFEQFVRIKSKEFNEYVSARWKILFSSYKKSKLNFFFQTINLVLGIYIYMFTLKYVGNLFKINLDYATTGVLGLLIEFIWNLSSAWFGKIKITAISFYKTDLNFTFIIFLILTLIIREHGYQARVMKCTNNKNL